MSLRLTGERQRRISGITSNGKIVPFFMGAEPGDDIDDKKNKSGSSASGSGSDDDDDDDDTDTDTDTDTSGTDTGNGRVYTESEVAGFINKMKAADKRASELQKRQDEAELATKSEIEQARIKLEKAQAEANEAREELKKSKIQNKFLAANKITWHDPETALQLLDISEVEIGDDGKITGIEEAIKKLADSKPFLIKAADGGDKDKNKNSGGKGGSTGNQPSGNGGGKDRDKDRARMLEKYPQLTRQR